MNWRNKCCAVFFFFICCHVQAQVRGAPPYFAYSNVLEGTENLAPIKQKIKGLMEGGQGSFKILHIGDSHVKSGFFSETVADSLNRFFAKRLSADSEKILLKVMAKNGGTSKYFLNDIYSPEDAKAFSPDLIIISLGTNEAQNLYTEKELDTYFTKLMDQVQSDVPGAALLITAAGDAQRKIVATIKRKRKYYTVTQFAENKTLPMVNAYLKKLANERRAAFWDWYKIMGARGAIMRWVGHGYAKPDRVHLLEKGYQLQGALLATAIIHYAQSLLK